MTILSSPKIQIADSVSSDAFGRLRVSNNVTLFNSIMQYSTHTWAVNLWDKWQTITGGGAESVNHLPNESAVSMDLTTVSGQFIIRQQHIYNRYQPGKSHLIYITGVMPVKANVTGRIGYFDDNDGIFFENDGINNKVGIRTSTSGSPVDNTINQSSWNLDKLDGTGASGITLDPTKSQLIYIDFAWLSVGRVRIGFNVNGVNTAVHEFLHANLFQLPYMKTANLPVRYEIRNTSTSASATSMKQMSSTVISEGGQEIEPGDQVDIASGVTSVAVDQTFRPVMNIRPKLQFNGINNTGVLEPLTVDVISLSGGANAEWCVVRNPTITGGTASWQDEAATKMTEFDVAQTGNAVSISDGDIILGGYAFIGGNQSPSQINHDGFISRIQLGTNYDFTAQDCLTVMARSFSVTDANIIVDVKLREFK